MRYLRPARCENQVERILPVAPSQLRITTRMQCPEYQKLWTAYIDASSEWRETVQTPSLSVYETGLRRYAAVLKQSAEERAAAHKRKCLLCANNGEKVQAQVHVGEPIIPGMNKPNRVFNGLTLCGDCGRPLKVSVGGVSACKNPACVRNKPASVKPN
jgi:hypothetical protein